MGDSSMRESEGEDSSRREFEREEGNMWVGGEGGGRESLWGGFLWKGWEGAGFLGNACFLCKGRGVNGLGGEGGRGKDGLAAGEMKPRPGTKLEK